MYTGVELLNLWTSLYPAPQQCNISIYDTSTIYRYILPGIILGILLYLARYKTMSQTISSQPTCCKPSCSAWNWLGTCSSSFLQPVEHLVMGLPSVFRSLCFWLGRRASGTRSECPLCPVGLSQCLVRLLTRINRKQRTKSQIRRKDDSIWGRWN